MIPSLLLLTVRQLTGQHGSSPQRRSGGQAQYAGG